MTNASPYSKKELLKRVLWQCAYVLLFRYSPRHAYFWRNGLLRLFGATIGKGVKIYPSASIFHPWLLEMRQGSVLSWQVRVYNLGKVSIGAHSIISQYAHICAGTHVHNDVTFPLIRSSITIGNGVWIAADAFVGPNVHIHDYGLVAARAVVIKEVLFNTIVGGNPAKVIGTRYNEDQLIAAATVIGNIQPQKVN